MFEIEDRYNNNDFEILNSFLLKPNTFSRSGFALMNIAACNSAVGTIL
jgi:hypothetical protein